jgi:hypothetical protein
VEKQYYSRLEVADLLTWTRKNTIVCPTDKILLRRTIATCKSALFFNEPHQIRSLRNRRILSPHFTSQFVKSDKDWIYSVPKKEAVTIKCIQNGTSFTINKVLEGRGILHNAAKCIIIGADFKVKSAQQTTILSTRHHKIIWLEPFEPLASHEVQYLRETKHIDYSQLDGTHRQQKDILIRIYDPFFKK